MSKTEELTVKVDCDSGDMDEALDALTEKAEKLVALLEKAQRLSQEGVADDRGMELLDATMQHLRAMRASASVEECRAFGELSKAESTGDDMGEVRARYERTAGKFAALNEAVEYVSGIIEGSGIGR